MAGAGGALAAAVNRTFAEAGWQLVLLAYSTANAERLASAYPDAVVHILDLTDETATRARFEALASVDAVLNLAGGFGMQAAAEATARDRDKLFALNFTTLFNVCRAVIPAMQAQGHGFIMGVAAAAADEGGAQMGLYTASKAAAASYLKSLRAELASDGIRVSILYPMGAIDTPANRNAMPNFPEAKWISADELAQAALYLAERSANGHVGDLRVHALAAL